MSQSEFEIVNGILDIWKIVIQAIMFFCGRRLSGRKNGARLVSLEISIDSEDYITTKCVGVLFFSGRGVKITPFVENNCSDLLRGSGCGSG